MQAVESQGPNSANTDSTAVRRRPQKAWTVVLAGGDGSSSRRNRGGGTDYVHIGAARPTQYRCYDGNATLLEQALESASEISVPERIVTLIGHGHSRHLKAEQIFPPGTVIEQPRQRGTAAATMICLAYVLAQDPTATITLLPSDQYIAPRERLNDLIESAGDIVEGYPHSIVALAALPTFAETEYGWLELGEALSITNDQSCFRAAGFCEKPSHAQAERLLAKGSLWNTLILNAYAETLWETAWIAFPTLMERMEVMRDLFADATSGPQIDDALAGFFTNLPDCDLARGLMSSFAPQVLVMPMQGVQWSDWGRSRRIAVAQPLPAELPSTVTSLRAVTPLPS
jgi:mannose-1-phosphate guanylyltransferase